MPGCPHTVALVTVRAPCYTQAARVTAQPTQARQARWRAYALAGVRPTWNRVCRAILVLLPRERRTPVSITGATRKALPRMSVGVAAAAWPAGMAAAAMTKAPQA